MGSDRKCEVCDNPKGVHKCRETGQLICQACRNRVRYRDRSIYEKCSGCGHDRPVTTRDEAGNPICSSCHNKHRDKEPPKLEICRECKSPKNAHTRDKAGRPICISCYGKVRRGTLPKREETVVKEVSNAPLATTTASSPRLDQCRHCGHIRISSLHDASVGICPKCGHSLGIIPKAKT